MFMEKGWLREEIKKVTQWIFWGGLAFTVYKIFGLVGLNIFCFLVILNTCGGLNTKD